MLESFASRQIVRILPQRPAEHILSSLSLPVSQQGRRDSSDSSSQHRSISGLVLRRVDVLTPYLAHLRSVVSFEAIGAFLRASRLLLAVDCSHGLAAADMRAQKSSENALKIQETARSYLEAVLLALGYESEELEAMLLRRDSRLDAGSEARVSSAVSVLFNLDKQNSSALLDDCPDLGFILSPDGSSCRVSG